MEYHIHWEPTLPSTNAVLRQRAGRDPSLPSGTVLAAREQTAGRGRHQRRWISPAGQNLTFSVLLRGPCPPERLPSASMAAAAAVAALLEAEGLVPRLKWPNDVLVNGRKICGILSEAFSGGLIIGIGLNVNMDETVRIDQPATSLRIETGAVRDPERLLADLLAHLDVKLDLWRRDGFEGVRADWERRAVGREGTVTVRDGAAVCTGLFAGFGSGGEMLLRGGDGRIRPVWAGDFAV